MAKNQALCTKYREPFVKNINEKTYIDVFGRVRHLGEDTFRESLCEVYVD